VPLTTMLGAPAFVGFLVEAGIISAFVAFLLNRLGRKLDQREDARIEESYLCMTMLKALGHLSEATAIAQQEGRCNGEMKTALTYYTKAKDGLNEFIAKKSAECIHTR